MTPVARQTLRGSLKEVLLTCSSREIRAVLAFTIRQPVPEDDYGLAHRQELFAAAREVLR